ncbi:hypothetical protein GGR26_000750 [Lewinella marina]|uniref:Uncharacterized protein n=1 Tax=Neolewinella marina TaxID=438751 RepID=A0A2G0CIP0_9BACT|nr:DUF5691 domain-containing protein [Neolewinella marina]NJB85005.1 hypothetical protein [Neolewinella marina]PHK99845.1 hypothetical protein CGL56_02030 [Neolewinella marina]
MATAPSYSDLLHALTLGTARRPVDPAWMEWLDERGAIDPVADAPEQLLASWALIERLHRLRERPVSPAAPDAVDRAPAETLSPPSPRLARGLQLMLEGPYTSLLEEGMELLLSSGSYLPHSLLPALLPRAAALLDEDPARASRWMRATGHRGPWLARQHPDWAPLGPDYDYAAAWRREEQPGKRATLLARWRYAEPAAARAALARQWDALSPRNQEVLLEGLVVGLSPDDHAWLREALAPKRKGVRRSLSRLLLLAGEPTAIEDFRQIARHTWQTGALDHDLQETLKAHGGVKAPQTLRQRLLEILPLGEWATVSGQPLPDFWRGLTTLELRDAGRAVRDFDDSDTRLTFLRYLLLEEPGQFPRDLATDLIRRISRDEFDALYDTVLTQRSDALRLRGLPRFLALQRRTSWNERLSKAMIRKLVDDLHSRQLDYATQRDLGLHWQSAIPLLDPQLFPWLRQQLHTTAERPDAFGKLAAELLQTTSLRRQLRQP